MGNVLSEAATVRMALESTAGTAPSSDWLQVQPNPGGIQNWEPVFDTVERDPLSVYASDEKGDNVGLRVEPKLVHDVTLDLLLLIASSMFRSAAKNPGGTGVALFRPSAVADGGVSNDSFTVDDDGDLPDGVLIRGRGFTNAANNGLKVTTGTSTTAAIKVATGTLVAETPPANATVMVVGFQGASGDIELDASGNLISTTLDFTTLGLVKGQQLIIGGETAGTQFATAGYNGRAFIAATPTANEIQLEDRSWTVGSADDGASKTIQIFTGPYYQNRPINDSDYLEPTLHGELEDIDAATSGTVPTYTYAEGLALATIELDAPLKSKIVATLSFIGMDLPDPVLTASRVSGPSSAYAPLAAALFDTSTDLEDVRLYDSSGSLIAEINSWKLTIDNNVKPREVQGTFGAVGHTYGKFRPRVTMEAYFKDYDQIKAVRDNRDLKWRAFVGNHQGGFGIRMPYVALRGGAKTYAANECVMLSTDIPGFRDPTTNVVGSMTLFGFVPNGGE